MTIFSMTIRQTLLLLFILTGFTFQAQAQECPCAPESIDVVSPACVGRPTVFQPFGVDDPNFGECTYRLEFGDGSNTAFVGSGDLVPHTYTQPGTYTVTLFFGSGCPTVTIQVEVLAPPAVDAGPGQIICQGSSVTIGTPMSGNFNYDWQVLNGDFLSLPANLNTPQITVSPNQNTLYRLQGFNGQCWDTSLVRVYVQEPINFTLPAVSPDLCVSEPVFFGPGSLNDPTVSYLWDFGNGLTSTIWYGGTAYANPGTYTVTLTSTNTCGTYTTSTTVTVHPLPTAIISTPPVICLNGGTFDLTPLGSPAGGTWSGPGVTGNTFDPQAVGNGSFQLFYSVVSAQGCPKSDNAWFSVKAPKNVKLKEIGPFCEGTTALEALVAKNAEGVWDGPGVISSGGQYFLDPSQLPAATYILSFTQTDGNGCETVDNLTFEITPDPDATFSPVGFCSDDPLSLLVPVVTGGDWSGNVGPGGEFDPGQGPGNYTVSYTAYGPGTPVGSDLIQNGGFEGYLFCPGDQGEIDESLNWDHLKTFPNEYADYFNGCHAPSSSTVNVDVPNNDFGTQTSHNGGQAYAGVRTYSANSTGTDPSTREYIVQRLDAPLVQGKTYRVKFYTSHAENSNAVTRIGALLSDTNPCSLFVNVSGTSALVSACDTDEALGLSPQIESAGAVTDRNWTAIEGTIRAQGGEEWIILGNFRVDDLSDAGQAQANGSFPGQGSSLARLGYYYIDDVSIFEVENVCKTTHTETIRVDQAPCAGAKTQLSDPGLELSMDVVPNPTRNRFNVTLAGLETGEAPQLALVDLSGQKLDVPVREVVPGRYVIEVSQLMAGVYLLQADAKAGRQVKRVVIMK